MDGNDSDNTQSRDSIITAFFFFSLSFSFFFESLGVLFSSSRLSRLLGELSGFIKTIHVAVFRKTFRLIILEP